MRARLRISIITLVTAIVLSLSALHLHRVVIGALDETGERAGVIGAAFQTCLTAFGQTDIFGHGEIRTLLNQSLNQDATISNILLLDTGGALIASAQPWTPGPLERWDEWQKHNIFWRAVDLMRARNDIALDIPAETADYKVRILFSPARLRHVIYPQLRDLAVLSILSLIVSVLLAALVSRLVSNSLAQLGHNIDLIVGDGDADNLKRKRFELPELATLDSKLWWLGRQFSGARTDIVRLRNNVETMLRQLDEVVFVFGNDNRLQMAGEPAERLLARSRESLLGQPTAAVFPEWTGPGAVLSRVVSSRVRVHEEPVILERANLPPVRLLMTVEPIEYGEGQAPGFMVALRDADTRQKIRADLDTARRLAAISKITSGVAHEIKNPLNGMMLHLQIALDKQKGGHDASNELGVVSQELLRLDRVVKTLLDFHKPIEPQLREVDLQVLTAEVAALVRPQAEALRIGVVVEANVKEAKVAGDPELLKQGLLNIAMNGLEAMKAGGVLHFLLEQTGSEISVSIRDNGAGIAPEIRDRIFNLYFTTKKSAGVGLAVASRIVLLHSGSITVDSEVGKGSCFRLDLPTHSGQTVRAS